MRAIKCLLPLLVPLVFGLGSAWGASEGASAQRKKQCLGRSIFETPTDIVWHLMEERLGHTHGSGFGEHSPGISTRLLKYQMVAQLPRYETVDVSMNVSPRTTRDIFEKVARTYRPDELDARWRVVKKEMGEISSMMTPSLSMEDPLRYELLGKKIKALEERIKRIHRVKVEIVNYGAYIDLDRRKGLATEKDEAELEKYEEEYATFPTDERYAKEMAFDFGMPDAYGAYDSGKLMVLLWRNERIYTFAFGSNYIDRPEWDPSVEAYVPSAHELLSRFRTREEFDIPEEPGFCIPFGFIADDGRAPYSLHMAWHPVNNPAYLHSLKLDNSVLGGLDLLLIPTARVMSPSLPLGDLVRAFGPIPIEVGTRKGIMGGFYNRSSDPEVEPPVFTENYSIRGGQAAKGLEPSLVLEVRVRGSQEPLPFDEAQEAFKTILKSFRVLPGLGKPAGT